MGGRFWISGIVMSVLALAGGFVVHGVLLHADYAGVSNLLRPEVEAQGYFGWMVLAHVLMGFGLTWIYVKGREPGKPPIAQGLRFGAAIAVLVTISTYLIYYAIQPWPGQVVVKQIIYDTICVLVMGAVVALINQGPKSA